MHNDLWQRKGNNCRRDRQSGLRFNFSFNLMAMKYFAGFSYSQCVISSYILSVLSREFQIYSEICVTNSHTNYGRTNKHAILLLLIFQHQFLFERLICSEALRVHAIVNALWRIFSLKLVKLHSKPYWLSYVLISNIRTWNSTYMCDFW